MYKFRKPQRSRLTSTEITEGETIEQKVERIQTNKEPIKDGAPEIFTERKDGVIAAYNIRSDRWEIAADAHDAISKSVEAQRAAKAKAAEEGKVVDMKGKEVGGTESTQGKSTGGDTN